MNITSLFHHATCLYTIQGLNCVRGCVTSYHCVNCNCTVQCDSTRAGTWADGTYFIDGPCCCVTATFGPCAACEAIKRAVHVAAREDGQREGL